jgi:SAM-dependent methyltransferase
MVDRELLKSVRKLDEGMRALGTSSAAAGQRLDVIVDRLDRLNAEVEQNTRFVSSFGLRGGSIAEPSADVDSYPEAPREPWTPDYLEGHREFVSRALDDPALLALFRRGGRLPEGYGVGFDERVVELPWLFTRDLTGSALDAGSTLNHAHVLARIQPRLDDLHIATLAPEPEAFPFMRVSYVFADLRDLPMRDGQYDVVVCLSTLEHVGMDNSQYGGGDRSPDPDAELRAALGELRRVLKPGGRLLLTVPFGEPEDFGWMRQLSSEGLDAITEAFGPSSAERRVYRYGEAGWQISTEDEAAHERYRDHYTTPEPAADRAVAARAVACLDLVR